MFAIHLRSLRCKVSFPLNAGILEDRCVLSAFGLLPTASDLLSAAPLPGLVRTVADLVPEVHVDVSISPAVEAAPLPALASPRDVLDGGLFEEDNALPTSGASAGFGIAAASSPKATVVLDVAGISVGL